MQDVGVEIVQQALAEPGEELMAGIDCHQLQREGVQPGHQLLVFRCDVHQAAQLPAEILVARPELLDLALDQRGGFTAFVFDIEDFEDIRALVEKIRMLAEVRCDNFLQ